VEVPCYCSPYQIIPLSFVHAFRVRRLDLEAPPLEEDAAFFEQPHSALTCRILHKAPSTLVTVDKSDKAPLGKKIANLVLIVPITDPSNKKFTRIGLAQEPCLALCLLRILPSWRGKSHGQWPRCARKMLRVYDCAISIRGKLEGNKCIRRFLRVALFGSNDTDGLHVTVPGKVGANCMLSCTRRQSSRKNLQLFSHRLVIVHARPHGDGTDSSQPERS